MAKNIAAGASNVRTLDPNRKANAAGRKLNQGAAAAAKAEDMLKAPAAPPPTEEPPQVNVEPRAPSFGANEPDAGVFLREVNKVRREMEKVEEAKLALKTAKGRLKDTRKLAAGVGLVMREMDEAIESLNTEHVDLIAREERRRLYFEWLGLPLGVQPSLPGMPAATDTEVEQGRWRKRGDIAGRLGQERKHPEGCPPHCIQAFLEGYDAGQEVLMRGSTLTRDAFTGVKPTAAEQKAAPGILVLNEGAFAAGTILDDANLMTLMPDRREAFDAAERVVALFGTKKRILKEEGYLDTGEEDVEVTEPEPITQADREATAAEFA